MSDPAAEAEVLLNVIRIGMKVLSHRLLTILAMLLGFGLFVWAMLDPVNNRVVMCMGWLGLVYLPALFKESKNG